MITVVIITIIIIIIIIIIVIIIIIIIINISLFRIDKGTHIYDLHEMLKMAKNAFLNTYVKNK